METHFQSAQSSKKPLIDFNPRNFPYRIYGNSVGMIMNLPAKRVVLLQKKALKCWIKLISKQADETDLPLLKQLAHAGVVNLPEGITSRSSSEKKTAYQDIETHDFGIVNYWAFKNQIPISGHFELTGRCNLRCRHCYCTFEQKKDTLSTSDIFKIIDDLHASGTFGLVLTGGEIFIRKDISKILDYLHEKQFVLRLNTNGTLLDETMVSRLKTYNNIYRAHVSLYGASPQVHDRVTGLPGSFKQTMAALHLLKEAGIGIRINCSVISSNAEDYTEVKYKIGDRLGLPVHYDPMVFPKDDGSTENLKELLSGKQLKVFHDFKTREYPESKERAASKTKKLCKAGFSFFSICEDGSLFPCLKMKRLYTHPLGNLKQEKFGTIWQGSKGIKQIRKALGKKLRECDICDLSI